MSLLSVRPVVSALVKSAPLQVRTVTNTPLVVSIPARKSLGKGQMALCGMFMIAGIWFTPIWVATHITTYNGTKK